MPNGARISRRIWAGAALAGLAAGVGVSAEAALRAITAHAAATLPATVPSSAVDAQDHFPGAALFYAVEENAAPAHSTTGTVAPPPEPVAVALPFDLPGAAIVPARPFSAGGASALDRGRALECLTAAIYYEAASESDDGERAVAQVVLNRVRHPAFPGTVCGVVYQGSERHGCQFSFACDGSIARARSRSGWARAMRFAAEALAGQVYAPVGLATHYHTYAVTPAWNRSLVMTDAVGAHFFHRWKGFWGTAAAFRQVYVGREPIPGPHPGLTDPALPFPALPPVVIASAATASPLKPITPPVSVQPAYADSGAALVTPNDSKLPDSPVLDRWKESGKALR